MKKLSLFISLFIVIQITAISQEINTTLYDTIPYIQEYQSEIIYRGDTIIVTDSIVCYKNRGEGLYISSKTLFKERDSKGRQLINIYYTRTLLDDTLYLCSRDSISYYANSLKEKYTYSYDRIMQNWKDCKYYLYSIDGLPLITEEKKWNDIIGQYYYGIQNVFTYNDSDSILSNVTNLYDMSTTYWYHSSKIEYSWDNNNYRIKEQISEYNSTISEWYPISNVEYLRNENSQILKEQTNKYSLVLNGWHPLSKIEYLFDDNSLLIEQKTNKYDYILSKWVNVDLLEYHRDSFGNDTLIVSSWWYLGGNLWKQQTKNKRDFDEGHRVILDVEAIWSDEIENWHFTVKSEYVYTEHGDQDTATHYKWYLEYGFWYANSRQSRDYDENRVLIRVVNEGYDLVYEYWYNVSRVMWEYENGKEVLFVVDFWENGAWFGDTRSTRSYNEDGNLDTLIGRHYGTVETGWGIIQRTTIKYNVYGLREFLHNDHQYHSDVWETANITYYYYSEYVLPSYISEYNQIEFKVYPNPTRGEIFIELDEISVGSAVAIISDMNGRIIEIVPINSSSKTIDLSRQQSGIYFIRLSNGRQTGTKRIVLH